MNKNIQVNLKFGKTEKLFSLPGKNVIDILEMRNIPAKKNPQNLIKSILHTPIATESLDKLINKKNPKKIRIIVSDITRPGPFDILLKPLIRKIKSTPSEIEYKKRFHGASKNAAEIKIIIANGTHRKMTEEEKRFHYGDFIVDNFPVLDHDCHANDLVDLGKMKSGNKLLINKEVAESDFLITLGLMNSHYFAGFSGGENRFYQEFADIPQFAKIMQILFINSLNWENWTEIKYILK